MRSVVALCSLIILVSCKTSPEVTSGRSSASINENAPYLWRNKTFPKTVRIDSSFAAAEITAIQDMGLEWKDAVDDEETWFAYGAPTNSSFNINEPDSIMGIYKASDWPDDIDSDALAITQIFGRRYNTGDNDEYVAIEHADIIMNFEDHNFYTGAAPGGQYDFRTVMLHEMGHFLGLQHIPSWWVADTNLSMSAYKATSVMYPSIGTSEEKRVPQTLDINELVYKYNLGGGGSGVSTASTQYKPKNGDPGQNIRILIELKASGECVHKEDGAVIQRHHVKLK